MLFLILPRVIIAKIMSRLASDDFGLDRAHYPASHAKGSWEVYHTPLLVSLTFMKLTVYCYP